MSELKTCIVCGSRMKEEDFVCGVCGFMNIPEVDGGDGTTVNTEEMIAKYKESDEYKQKIIAHITDISVEIYQYGYKDEEFKWLRTVILKIASGEECNGKVKWTELGFGQNPENRDDREIKISYKFAGVNKTLTAMVKPVKCDDLWKIGVMLDDELRLFIYIGNQDNALQQSVSEAQMLDLYNG